LALVASAQQPDSTSFYTSFYPLEVGNSWQYERGSPNVLNSANHGFYPFHRVVGDTTMSNGLRYKVIEHRRYGDDDVRFRYERVDADNLTVLRYDPFEASLIGFDNNEVPALLLPSSSYPRTFIGNADFAWQLTCRWGDFVDILGEDRLEWQCHFYRGGYFTFSYRMVSQIGVTEYHESGESYFFSDRLIHFVSDAYEAGIPVETEETHTKPHDNSLNLFPNPVSGSELISLEWADQQRLVSVQVFNVVGRQIAATVDRLGPGRATLRLSDAAPKGVYFVTIQFPSFLRSSSFIYLGDK
jgi:hypothetical protein